jgi:GNAT superfamily N-acetyltransferase
MTNHLAQLNLSTLREPIDHPASREFRDALPIVNGAGEAAAGFVWRLRDEDPYGSGATGIRLFDDPRAIINLTVWESREQLREFAFSGLHRDFLRRRTEWFLPGATHTVLWHVPTGFAPTPHHAMRRLWAYGTYGTGPAAFQFPDHHPELVVAPTSLDDTVAQELIAELDRDLWEREPVDGVHHFGLAPDDVAPGTGQFLVAHLDGEPVGCGAYRLLGDGRAEVKRMYVRAGTRGARVGAAVLSDLIAGATAAGATSMVLETGRSTTPEAVALYRRFGFTETEPWGDYIATADTSLCMALPLSGTYPSP